MDNFYSKQITSLEDDLKAFQVVQNCHILKKTPRKDGYATFTIRILDENGKVKKTSVSCHRAALIVKLYKQGQIDTLQIDEGLECSHLCHKKICVNDQHLVLEERYVNDSRKTLQSA